MQLSVHHGFGQEKQEVIGLDFNPGPSAPRADGSRNAELNVIGPFSNLDGLITYILVQGARVDHSDNDADTDEAPAPPPKPHKQKKPKASRSAAPPKTSRAKPLATSPPEDSVQSEDQSRIKTWVLEWMTGNVHHEAKAMDIIELTGLATPGELYEPDCQLHRNAVESIFHKQNPI